ncbi:MAG: Asp-tRNA(Asn)/Glu-tRNA(Gln) amidotransferase subunit GatC [Candidatus Dojkabacteria bacterium]
MTDLTPKQLKKFADLARIKLTDEELKKFGTEISSILAFVSKLKEVDVSDIEYASHVDDFKGDVLREDVPGNAMTEDDVFRNASKRRSGEFFSTSKII